MANDSDSGHDGPTPNDESMETTGEPLVAGSSVLDASLPRDLGTALGRLVGEDPVETLDDWVSTVRRRTGGGSITVEDLCHDGEGTAHWGDVDGERYHFTCFYDAVILAALVEKPVDVRTESPGGTVIEARATGSTDLQVDPEGSVFSFGVADDVSPPDGDPTHADVYGAVCPYVRAFPDRDTYERWAGSTPATTVAMPLAGATDVAAVLVE